MRTCILKYNHAPNTNFNTSVGPGSLTQNIQCRLRYLYAQNSSTFLLESFISLSGSIHIKYLMTQLNLHSYSHVLSVARN